MGCYMNDFGEKVRGKAAHLVNNYGAEIIALEREGSAYMFIPPTDKEVMVCIVENGPFDAVGVAYDEKEFNDFNRPDGRSKV